MTITEPAVTLTDLGLALESGLFVWLLYRLPPRHNQFRTSFMVFFAALGVASLAGAVVHGLLHNAPAWLQQLTWDLTLIAIGVVALSAWRIGAFLALHGTAQVWINRLAWLVFIGYCLVVTLVNNTFLVAIVHYLPATLFLLVVFALKYVATPRNDFLCGLAGMFLTFVSAAIQQTGITLHPVYFDHNALYHTVQAIALVFLFLAARGMARLGG